MSVVVVDTNVFIHALFLKDTWCQRVLQLESEGTIKFVFNQDMVKELNKILIFQLKENGVEDRVISWASDKVQTIIWRSERVKHNIKSKICTEDPSDNMFIDCAIESKSSVIISDNGNHLTSKLEPIIKKHYNHQVKIVSPFQYNLQGIQKAMTSGFRIIG